MVCLPSSQLQVKKSWFGSSMITRPLSGCLNPITYIINGEWFIRIPIFYDGERLVLYQRNAGENGEFCMYDIATDKWRKIGIVWAILDNIRAFVPFVPSLAEIKTTPWPDVSTRVVQSIHKLSLLLGAGVTLKKDVLQLKWAEPNSYSKDL